MRTYRNKQSATHNPPRKPNPRRLSHRRIRHSHFPNSCLTLSPRSARAMPVRTHRRRLLARLALDGQVVQTIRLGSSHASSLCSIATKTAVRAVLSVNRSEAAAWVGAGRVWAGWRTTRRHDYPAWRGKDRTSSGHAGPVLSAVDVIGDAVVAEVVLTSRPGCADFMVFARRLERCQLDRCQYVPQLLCAVLRVFQLTLEMRLLVSLCCSHSECDHRGSLGRCHLIMCSFDSVLQRFDLMLQLSSLMLLNLDRLESVSFGLLGRLHCSPHLVLQGGVTLALSQRSIRLSFFVQESLHMDDCVSKKLVLTFRYIELLQQFRALSFDCFHLLADRLVSLALDGLE